MAEPFPEISFPRPANPRKAIVAMATLLLASRALDLVVTLALDPTLQTERNLLVTSFSNGFGLSIAVNLLAVFLATLLYGMTLTHPVLMQAGLTRRDFFQRLRPASQQRMPHLHAFWRLGRWAPLFLFALSGFAVVGNLFGRTSFGAGAWDFLVGHPVNAAFCHLALAFFVLYFWWPRSDYSAYVAEQSNDQLRVS